MYVIGSLYHIFNKMGLTRSKAMEKYLGIAKDCMASGLVPRCHLEDVTRSDIYGFVIPFVIELNKLSEESGIPVKIRVCDTLGLGLAFPSSY